MVNDVNADSKQNPVVLDSEFQIEEFVSGLFVPVNMEFGFRKKYWNCQAY
jgi:hypothetical protein